MHQSLTDVLWFRSNYLFGRRCVTWFSVDNVFHHSSMTLQLTRVDDYQFTQGCRVLPFYGLLHDLHCLCGVFPLCLHNAACRQYLHSNMLHDRNQPSGNTG